MSVFEINLDGKRYLISDNLMEALRAILSNRGWEALQGENGEDPKSMDLTRKQRWTQLFSKFDKPPPKALYWIDQICVDQENISERPPGSFDE